MNKAFVKENDSTDGRCPRCGSPGNAVYRETLEAHLARETLDSLNDMAFFCPFARCSVVYFDLFDRVVEETAVGAPVYPKNPLAPLCACFGLTCDDVEQDLRDGGVARTRACIEKAKSSEARCAVASPSGQSCITEVQRYYMKRRGELGLT
jgi:Zinc binding domain